MGDMRLVVVGAGGRMGRALIRTVTEMDGVVVSGAVERTGSEFLGKDAGELAGCGKLSVPVTANLDAAFEQAEGVLDFTIPEATVGFATAAARHSIVHVIGTTGMTSAQSAELVSSATSARIVKSGNMSLGVNLLAGLVKKAAAALDEDFDIEVLEMHHKHKVDAPSGTALLLGEAAAEGRGIDLETNSVRTRDGITGARNRGDIGFATLRGGSVVGEHTVMFAGEGERIDLSHIATDRHIFARGAVKAALWALKQQPGLYSMADVLGLNDE
ncbi:4-hydroxy-tetrahydrodipicolinate reductase [Pseudovibrio sp. Tun.PSC04-5.I4]|uniref:4-hydroxy-tetrahydrodipicolinate reductase n=1 Tax=Pseudovibrio sp. Tun.PSC04-5.I4 TaxID=1798213 RepID=UPI000890CF46|nr:4-hydroxy-tetrahydrodipicolinate reductase [Pseudovibrio sp. Tun.PSC04-5.I4]SDR24655.1 dihydrodipicolinate reductase [Pseudovibrio sp. Tun.PSC04-5.I4]